LQRLAPAETVPAPDRAAAPKGALSEPHHRNTDGRKPASAHPDFHRWSVLDRAAGLPELAEAELVDFPTLLDFPAPRLRCYPRETVIAEKIEAMVQLGMANSRMKDFFDIVMLADRFPFDGELLARAIRATFTRRLTAFPHGLPVAFTDVFANDASKRTHWTAFVRKVGIGTALDLPTTIPRLATFTSKPLVMASTGALWEATWLAGGPWSDA